jgi:hypothetical protein
MNIVKSAMVHNLVLAIIPARDRRSPRPRPCRRWFRLYLTLGSFLG